MNFKWKKTVTVVALFIFAGLLFLGSKVFENSPAIGPAGFVFIFLAYIVLFPFVISHQRPRLSEWAYQFNRRAPPLS